MRTALETAAAAARARLANVAGYGPDACGFTARAARGKPGDHRFKIENPMREAIEACQGNAAIVLAVVGERNARIGVSAHGSNLTPSLPSESDHRLFRRDSLKRRETDPYWGSLLG